jgi:hypothetical protein
METILENMKWVLGQLQLEQPKERSEKSRYYAVTITEMEKVIAYYETYCKEE